MIRQSFHIKQYWKVIIWYNLNYDFFDTVADELYIIGASKDAVEDIYYNYCCPIKL